MRPAPRSHETGIALITTLLVLMMVSALMVGFFATITADQRASGIDRDQTQAYAAAHAGLEKMTSDLATLFAGDVSPSVAQINAVAVNPPTIPNFGFIAPGGGSGYTLTFTPDAFGNPAPKDPAGSNITSGPYQGFKGIITEYPITVTARSNSGGSEVRLRRVLNTIAVPVFQFGVFSENDLTFLAGDDFDFGGRVHTNGSLFLSELNGLTLRFTDRITAVSQVARAVFSNGLGTTANSFAGAVMVPTNIAAGTFRDLQEGEGSVTGMPGGATYGPWFGLSTGTYASNIRNGLSGAKRLDLPLVTQGAVPIDLIRRPIQGSNEQVVNPAVYGQRLFSQASLRILLSETAADITTLPTVTAGVPPVLLDGDWYTTPPNNGTAYGAIGTARPPIALSPGTRQTTLSGALAAASATINVASTAPFVPAITLNGVTFNCTGKTVSTFTGCAGAPAGIIGQAITAGPGVSTTVGLAHVAGAATVTTAVNGTIPFVPLPFWVANNLVTCTGYTSTQFTTCVNAPAGANGAAVSTNALSSAGVGLIGGYLKIERQSSTGVWTDVTMEILNLGIGGPNLEGGALIGSGSGICADPTPNAVIRLQRLRLNASSAAGTCGYATTPTPKATDYWPNVLYDTREGNMRQVATTAGMVMGGVMHYVELDIANLKRWFAGTIGTTGTLAWNNNGYIVYFSDRRSNRNGANETGEYGYEDVVNPTTAAGTPDGILQTGEDVQHSTEVALGYGTLQTYGATPPSQPAGAGTPYTTAAGRPTVAVTLPQALVNRSILFRRALKLRNGGINAGVNNLPTSGLTVASENPVYVQGNYNATTSPTAEPNVPASVLADAVTLLSNNWSDMRSVRNPNDSTANLAAPVPANNRRLATTTGYRFAVVAGKNPSFPWPTVPAQHFLYGTDGGVGNFLRLLEDWQEGGAVAVNYRGSIVSLYFSRQAVGSFKYTTNRNVYDYADRNFAFDTDFLLPALLPAGTPMFRDVNTLTFRQLLRPTQ
jgi:type II secretory pathway pseudopilin PulG